MNRRAPSILVRLQVGIAVAALVVACGLAAFMDSALRHSLEREDGMVMEGQVHALLQAFEAGQLPAPSGVARRPEKAEWRLLDAQGRTVAESLGMAGMPALIWPEPGLQPIESEGPAGIYSLMSRACPQGAAGTGRLLLAMDRTHEEVLIGGFRRTLALGVLLFSLGAALLGRFIARWGLRPLRRISLEAGMIHPRNLDRRLEEEAFPRELQELVATLNATLERLESAFQRLSRFGAELAHEFRTPLQNLRSTLENLTLRGDAPATHLNQLGGLLEDCDRMAALIEQILFLARSEGLEAALATEPVDVLEALEEAHAFFEAAAEEAGVALVVHCEPGLTFQGGPLLVLRALHNLVANALRHTPSGGAVTLGGRRAEGTIVLWVEDTGEGIPVAWQTRILQAFVRGPGTENTEGLGIGLAIVQRIADMHDARLLLHSREGVGTRVELHFQALEN